MAVASREAKQQVDNANAVAKPDTHARRELRRNQTRERLLTAASELFVSRGYDPTTFDDIARHAGVSRQTVFNHFPRKEAFVTAWGVQRRQQIHMVISRGTSETESSTAQMIRIMQAMADAYERSPAEGRVYVNAWVRLGGPIIEERWTAQLFAVLIRAGQKSGEFRSDLDSDTCGALVSAAYFDALLRWSGPHDASEPLLLNLLIRLDIILAGLGASEDRDTQRRSIALARVAVEGARPQRAASPPS